MSTVKVLYNRVVCATGDCPCVILILCGFVVFTTRRSISSLTQLTT